MKKVTLILDENNNVYDNEGSVIGMLMGSTVEPDENITVTLVKQGVSVDEIIKLKNMDLI